MIDGHALSLFLAIHIWCPWTKILSLLSRGRLPSATPDGRWKWLFTGDCREFVSECVKQLWGPDASVSRGNTLVHVYHADSGVYAPYHCGDGFKTMTWPCTLSTAYCFKKKYSAFYRLCHIQSLPHHNWYVILFRKEKEQENVFWGYNSDTGGVL